jgi:hypothetical protein
VRPISLLVLGAAAFAVVTGVVLGVRVAADVTAADVSSSCTAGPVSSAAPRTTVPRPLLGMWWNDSANAKGTLAEVDPRTLAVGRSMAGPWGSSWAFSPDGRRLALGGGEGAVGFVDLTRMRRLGGLRSGGQGSVVALAWPSRNRLLAVEEWWGDVVRRAWLLVIDPLRGRLLERRALEGAADEVEEANGRIVTVIAPSEEIGPARLVVAEPDGRLRCVVLTEISTGREHIRTERVVRIRKPGLALDPAGDRAFVVSAEEPIAEVDLRNLRVSYHRKASASLLGRLLDWLEPEAHAKGLPLVGSRRQALWLGNGLLAVSGSEQSPGQDGRYSEAPAGLKLVDTETGAVRTLDERVGRILLADDALLAFGGYGSERLGVHVYGLDGRLRFRLFVGEEVGEVQTAGTYAYVLIEREVTVVDLRSGKVIADGVQPPGELLAGEERPWF